MNLEDHLGDILSKARAGRAISSPEAAAAAGLSETAYSQLESTGKSSSLPQFAPLAAKLGLDSRKLQGIAQGWLPSPVDLARWQHFHTITTVDDRMSVNSFLVWDSATRDAAAFDTGFDEKPLIKIVEKNQLALRHLFITHTHYDHVYALGPIRKRFPEVQLHSSSKNAPASQRNRPEDVVQLGSLKISNRATPGHAEDGATYIIAGFPNDAPMIAIVGDAIFAGSMGGAKQAFETAHEKIRSEILSLPADTLIGPGHGPLTTVGQEKENNPFFP